MTNRGLIEKFCKKIQEDHILFLEMQILIGCFDCGRRITDGKHPLPGTTIILVSNSRRAICEHCLKKY